LHLAILRGPISFSSFASRNFPYPYRQARAKNSKIRTGLTGSWRFPLFRFTSRFAGAFEILILLLRLFYFRFDFFFSHWIFPLSDFSVRLDFFQFGAFKCLLVLKEDVSIFLPQPMPVQQRVRKASI